MLKLGRPDEALKALTRARSSAAGQPGTDEIDRMLERARQDSEANPEPAGANPEPS